MSKKDIELKMSNVAKEPIDLLHRVVSTEGSVWANPYNTARSYVDQVHNYRKYTNYLSNMLYLKAEPFTDEYKKLIERAKEDGLLVFECTCFPGPCHMDAIRERLTKDLEKEGYHITSNQGPIVTRGKTDEDENNE